MLDMMRFAVPRLAPLALVLALAALAGRAPAAERQFVELPPGRYTMSVKGLLCAVCARAVAAEWKKLPEVEDASVSRESGKAELTVRIDRTLKVASLVKALKRAETTANLGASYQMSGIAYRLDAGR